MPAIAVNTGTTTQTNTTTSSTDNTALSSSGNINLTVNKDVTFAFVPATLTVAANTTFEISVNLSAGTNKVNTAGVVVYYDPAIIKITDIVRGSEFDMSIGKEINATTGAAELSVSTSGSKYATPTATIVTIKGQRIASGATKLTLGTDTPTLSNDTQPNGSATYIDSTGVMYYVGKAELNIL